MKCVDCGYTTEQKGHFNVHKKENCKSANAIKDKNCPVCCKRYTHNTLRFHLGQYTKDTSKAKNGHQYFTPQDHVKMLAKLKAEKKIEKKREKIITIINCMILFKLFSFFMF